MLNRYPWWKYLIIFLVIAAGLFYALPNLFGEDPALQISAARTGQVDQDLYGRVERELQASGLEIKGLELTADQLLVRFQDIDDQLEAVDLLQVALGSDYTVALNLAPATPGWIQALGMQPMYLGLDLQGGVHFLMEVDMEAAVKQAEERYVEDLRGLLREARIRYASISRREGGGIAIRLRGAAELDAAQALIEDELPNLLVRPLETTTAGGEPGHSLSVVLGDEELEERRRLALEQNITTLRNRVNELGVAEPIIQQQGNSRIVVQLPGVQDTARAKEILGATATLEFRLVDEEHDARQAQASGRVPLGSLLYRERSGRPVLLERRVMLTGDYITDAQSGIDQQTGSPAVFITLDGKGARRFEQATKDKIGRLMAVVFIENKTETRRREDGELERTTTTVEEVINIATIRDRLGKRFQITGLDSTTEARDLALLLRAGALAAPVQIIEERTVGPSAGRENIDQGFQSALVAFLLVLGFMSLYYRVFGLVSNLALFVNVVLIVALLSMLQATLTLPGIAGIVLTMGMAVDANVLIFERIREEVRLGNSPQAAIHSGFSKAFSTIMDANVTTLIAAIVLFGFGTGPVKGFAVTVSIGIVTSMFTAIMGARGVVNAVYGGRRVQQLSI